MVELPDAVYLSWLNFAGEVEGEWVFGATGRFDGLAVTSYCRHWTTRIVWNSKDPGKQTEF